MAKQILDTQTGELESMQGLHLTMQQLPPRFYEPVGLSITNPDAGLTIREMVEKYASGEPGYIHDVFYDESEENALPTGLDMSDVTQAQEFTENVMAKAEKAKAISHSDEVEPPITEESGGNARKGKPKPSAAKAKAAEAGVRPDSSGSSSDEKDGEA